MVPRVGRSGALPANAPPGLKNALAIAAQILGRPPDQRTAAALMNSGFLNSKTPTDKSCANFVSTCLEKAGLINFHSDGAQDLYNKLQGAGFQKVDLSQAKPGDVVLCNNGHHIAMFAGWKDGKVGGEPLFIGSNNVNGDGSQSVTVGGQNGIVGILHNPNQQDAPMLTQPDGSSVGSSMGVEGGDHSGSSNAAERAANDVSGTDTPGSYVTSQTLGASQERMTQSQLEAMIAQQPGADENRKEQAKAALKKLLSQSPQLAKQLAAPTANRQQLVSALVANPSLTTAQASQALSGEASFAPSGGQSPVALPSFGSGSGPAVTPASGGSAPAGFTAGSARATIAA